LYFNTQKRIGRPPFNPNGKLDDFSKAILNVEAHNPGINTTDIINILGRNYDRRTIYKRRASGSYQRALAEIRKDAQEVYKDSQINAIRMLDKIVRDALESGNITQKALSAAIHLSKLTHEQCKAEIAKELNEEKKGVNKEHVVRVIMVGDPWVIGDPPITVESRTITESTQTSDMPLLSHEKQRNKSQEQTNNKEDKSNEIQETQADDEDEEEEALGINP